MNTQKYSNGDNQNIRESQTSDKGQGMEGKSEDTAKIDSVSTRSQHAASLRGKKQLSSEMTAAQQGNPLDSSRLSPVTPMEPSANSERTQLPPKTMPHEGKVAEVENSQEFQNDKKIEKLSSSTALSRQELANLEAASEWSTFGLFRLKFQARNTQGVYEERLLVGRDDQQEKIWLKPNDVRIYDWILNQVEGLKSFSSDKKSNVSKPTIEVTRVLLLQPNTVSAGMIFDAGRLSSTSLLYSRESVIPEISFKLIGKKPSDTAGKALSYQIRGHFHYLLTGADVPVRSEVGYLVKDQNRYTVRLSEVNLLPGPHQLQVVITLDNSSISPAVLEVPILQVI